MLVRIKEKRKLNGKKIEEEKIYVCKVMVLIIIRVKELLEFKKNGWRKK